MTSSPSVSTYDEVLHELGVSLAAVDARPGEIVAGPLPPSLLAQLTAAGDDALRRRAVATWEAPNGRLFALGEAVRLSGARGHDPGEAFAALRALRVRELAPMSAGRPRLFGGFEFDPFNPCRDDRWEGLGGWQFVLPSVLLEEQAGEWSGSVTVRWQRSPQALAEAIACALEGVPAAPVGPGRRPVPGADPRAWTASVAEAVRRIHRGAFEKVVLARSIELECDRERPEIVARLAERYPATFVFSLRACDATWLGATPERLVSLHHGRVRAASLAGSRPRAADPAEDDRLAAELFASAKERAEHAVVVEVVREALEPLCTMLTVPREPELMRIPNIQHLYTPVAGQVRPGVDIFGLVAAMHPTPAVGGWPRQASLAAIRELEAMDRGWYAAPIGWVDLAGEGEFAVALRSALIEPGRATLYAGAGVVAGSDPEQELAETELKLRPLREAVTR
ncbi:MAG: isochorismate synthase [Hyphomicrobiales bacterium]